MKIIEDVLKYVPILNKHMWRNIGPNFYSKKGEAIYHHGENSRHNKLSKTNPNFTFENYEGIEIIWNFKLHFCDE